MCNAPCLTCDRKGCGSYHDQCEAYQNFRKQQMEKNEQLFEIRKGWRANKKASYRTPEASAFKNHMK